MKKADSSKKGNFKPMTKREENALRKKIEAFRKTDAYVKTPWMIHTL